jgi:hypothetical protein
MMSGKLSNQAYTVYVDDNFHYMDESERYKVGAYPDCETAIQKCKEIVDEFLLSNRATGMTAKQLFELYTTFGEDPGIVGPEGNCKFSAWTYARQRSEELCAGSQ